MAKISPIKKSTRKTSSTVQKKLDALMGRISALEDLNFGQKLLIDELENRLTQVEKTIEQYMNPSWMPTQTYHVCQFGGLDALGYQYCVTCGQQRPSGYGGMITTTSGSGMQLPNGTYTVSDTASGTIGYAAPIDDFEIVWDTETQG